MSFDKGEQRARWMKTPPNHTLTVTMSWPQLTPWPLTSLTSHWLGLNGVCLQGFMTEKEKKRCFAVTFWYLTMQQFSNVPQLKDTYKHICALSAYMWSKSKGPVVANAWLLLLFQPFAKQSSIHHLTFPSQVCADKNDNLFSVYVSRRLHPVGDRKAKITARAYVMLSFSGTNSATKPARSSKTNLIYRHRCESGVEHFNKFFSLSISLHVCKMSENCESTHHNFQPTLKKKQQNFVY